MEVLKTAVLDFCRRKKGVPFAPSDVLQQMFPEDWELFMPEILEVIGEMAQSDQIVLLVNGIAIAAEGPLSKEVMIQSKPNRQ